MFGSRVKGRAPPSRGTGGSRRSPAPGRPHGSRAPTRPRRPPGGPARVPALVARPRPDLVGRRRRRATASPDRSGGSARPARATRSTTSAPTASASTTTRHPRSGQATGGARSIQVSTDARAVRAAPAPPAHGDDGRPRDAPGGGHRHQAARRPLDPVGRLRGRRPADDRPPRPAPRRRRRPAPAGRRASAAPPGGRSSGASPRSARASGRSPAGPAPRRRTRRGRSPSARSNSACRASTGTRSRAAAASSSGTTSRRRHTRVKRGSAFIGSTTGSSPSARADLERVAVAPAEQRPGDATRRAGIPPSPVAAAPRRRCNSTVSAWSSMVWPVSIQEAARSSATCPSAA